MSQRVIGTYAKNFEEIKQMDSEGSEYWYARELMIRLEYTSWRNFEKVIEKAKQACFGVGEPVENHFVELDKMVSIGYGNGREINDYKLSRYACYLIAQNGDPKKRVIAAAQSYFAVQTRRQEIFQQLSKDGKRLFMRREIKTYNTELNDAASHAGVKNYARFNDAGYRGLYGGLTLYQVRQKKDIGTDHLLDRVGPPELAANAFRITQTTEKLKRDQVRTQYKADETHHEVGDKVRATIKALGGTMPEDLKPEEHIRYIESRASNEIKTVESKQQLLATEKKKRQLIKKDFKGRRSIVDSDQISLF